MLGGLLGPKSYASSYPSPEDLYLERVYPLKDDGAFERDPILNTDGIWIQGSQISFVEFIKP